MFVLASVAVLGTSLYSRALVRFSMKIMEQNIESRLMETSKRGSGLVSAEELDIYREAKDMELPGYQTLRLKLREFAEDSGVLYAYYLRPENGMLQYIADNDFDTATKVDLNTPSLDIALTPAAAPALLGEVSTSDLGDYKNGWDGLLSAFAPVFDKDGNVAAIFGVDINDELLASASRTWIRG